MHVNTARLWVLLAMTPLLACGDDDSGDSLEPPKEAPARHTTAAGLADAGALGDGGLRSDAGTLPGFDAGDAAAAGPVSDSGTLPGPTGGSSSESLPCMRDQCIGNAIYRCIEDGTELALFLACDDQTQQCEDSDGGVECVASCAPGQPLCDGNLLTTCDENGTTPVPGGLDCALEGRVCDPLTAACATRLCEPHTSYCKDGDVYQCGPAGASERLFDDCEGAEYCESHPLSAYCVPDQCLLGESTCRGTWSLPCTVEGFFDEAAAVDCSTFANHVCSPSGQCMPLICTPYESGCSNAMNQQCDVSGTEWFDLSSCAGEDHCELGSCRPDVCLQGQPACAGNQIGTCNADGSGSTPSGADCAALGQVCTVDLACAAQAVDIVGLGSGVSYGWHGPADVYLVSSNRHLTRIETTLGISGGPLPMTLDWFVYESVDGASFGKIFELSVPVTEDDVQHDVDSGAISVQLLAGRQYLIGVHSASNLSVQHDAVAAGMTSFGRHLGAANPYDLPQAILWNSWAGNFYQKLTTGP